jgi:hypothetical protein
MRNPCHARQRLSCFNPVLFAMAATLLLSLTAVRADIVLETTLDEAIVTRYFQPGSSGFPFPTPAFRSDYVVGNGTNGVRPGPFTANVGNNSTFTFVIKAPPARRIVIKPPTGSWSGCSLNNNISFLAPGTPGSSSAVTPTITFDNLIGSPPQVALNSSTLTTPDGLRIAFNVTTSNLTSEVSFTAMRFSFTYGGINPTNRTYSFDTGYLTANASGTSTASDPGPMVIFRNLESVPVVHSDIALYAGISFPTTSNRIYVVQYVPDVNSTNWITLTNLQATTTNSIFFDLQSPGKARRFYQVLEP